MRASTSLQRETGAHATGLASAFIRTRQASIDLAAALEPEDCVIQTIPEVSPTKWHLAHTTWFFEQFCLLDRVPSYRPCNDVYLYLFNSYYNTVGAMHARPERGLLSRPLLSEVLAYRSHVDEAMLGLLADDYDELGFLVTLGMQHEQQHQELMLTDIKHVFFTNPLRPAYRSCSANSSSETLPLEFVGQAGGRFAIGYSEEGFCFDNETPRHDVLVDDHELANRPITNSEYREFIDDGGYHDARLWLADGWAQVHKQGWQRPLYWSSDLETEYTLAGQKPIDAAAPVCHVSFYEADAYARWSNARLPTEVEWELAADAVPVDGNTLDQGRLHPVACSARADLRLHQIWGDVWEWTSSPYTPYPGFQPLQGSLGEYNGKFMANQMVVRGGSCVTWAEQLRASYRSFFYPHDRWQFLGFRLARTLGRS